MMKEFGADEIAVWRRHPITKALAKEFDLMAVGRLYREADDLSKLGYAHGMNDATVKLLRLLTDK
jgi:hypothetical protein